MALSRSMIILIDAPELTTGFTPKQHYPILKEAYDNKDVIFKDVLFRRLLFYLFVLEYKEGGLRWYDLHPAVKQVLIKKLSRQGHSQREIADTIHVGIGTINRDVAYLRNEAHENLKNHIQDNLPEEYQNCMVGINQVLKICWEIVNKSRNVNNENGQTVTMTDNKTVLQALALINDCNKYKMDLTTNGVVITDAIKFVQTNKEKLIFL